MLPIDALCVGASSEEVEGAARSLRQGGVVAFPTETVYGLGADATNADAVAAVYMLKGRSVSNPLIVHTADFESAGKLGYFPSVAEKLVAAFWPGPLTLVVSCRKGSGVVPMVMAGLGTIAIRSPSHPLARELLRAARIPIAAPSANPSGRVSPTRAWHVSAFFSGRLAGILDGGATPMGLESTIIGFEDQRPVFLRAGALPREEIEQCLGEPLAIRRMTSAPTAPGQFSSHYAPRAVLRLGVSSVVPGEALLAFGPRDIVGASEAVKCLNLSPSGHLEEAARNLFDFLHCLDSYNPSTIGVAPIPVQGLGEAINDRLIRAAAPRSGGADWRIPCHPL